MKISENYLLSSSLPKLNIDGNKYSHILSSKDYIKPKIGMIVILHNDSYCIFKSDLKAKQYTKKTDAISYTYKISNLEENRIEMKYVIWDSWNCKYVETNLFNGANGIITE